MVNTKRRATTIQPRESLAYALISPDRLSARPLILTPDASDSRNRPNRPAVVVTRKDNTREIIE